jgi:hypothetical protein
VNEFPGEDERVRIMLEKDEADCEEEGHADTELVCVRCGKPLPRKAWTAAEWEADLWDDWKA